MGLTGKQKQRIESVFHEALKLAPQEREKFLANACADDDTVRQEAASLVRHYESASDLEHLGKASHGLQDELPLPERIGLYDVQGRLGRGGMGEVFLARDPRLGRKVAIKVLSPAIAETPEAMERLRREALAASALNHPNILTVHEFGEAEGRQYIVTEYVEGESLREKIGELSPEQVLDYARQIGEALAAAHKAGIIHRDIKPENVMVRPDGYVKVLDFGLAKAAPLAGAGTTSIQQRLEQGAATAPGILIGTISYMSPEQVRGQEVDQRTDIWSWGVVLYEMLTGKRPFEGETASDVIAAILNEEPHALRGNGGIERILSRALAKKPEERYQAFGDALAEVNQVSGGSLDRLRHQPQKSDRFQSEAGRGKKALQWIAVLAAALACILVVYFAVRPAKTNPLRILELKRLTNTGNVAQIGISPDADYIAYATSEGTKQTLMLRQMSTGAETQRLPAIEGEYKGITFSQGFIYFVIYRNKARGILYRMPMLAGDYRMIVDDVDSGVSFSPSGDRFTFLRASRDNTKIMMFNLKSGQETVLAELGGRESFWSVPLWSPDGSLVVSEAYDDAGLWKLMSVRVRDGRLQAIPLPGWTWMNKPAWVSGGRAILVAAVGSGSTQARLHQVSIPGAETSEISADLYDYSDVDSSIGARRILGIQRDRLSSIWLTRMSPDPGKPIRLTAPGGRFYGVTWSNSQTVISQSGVSGHSELWSINGDSGEMHAITDDSYLKAWPESSPDGKFLIYSSTQDGVFHLWRLGKDNVKSTRITSGTSAEEEGVISPDSKWVIFTSLKNGERTLWRVPSEGGEPKPISDRPAMRPSISPDGRLLACEYSQDATSGMKAAILDAKTGKLLKIFPAIPLSETSPRLRWSADSRQILFVLTRNGVSNIWSQPVDGGEPQQITHYEEDEIFAFAPSPDGKRMACVRGRKTADAVLIRIND
jgi:eukaryotic-like serine/threonine-protein kinase